MNIQYKLINHKETDKCIRCGHNPTLEKPDLTPELLDANPEMPHIKQ